MKTSVIEERMLRLIKELPKANLYVKKSLPEPDKSLLDSHNYKFPN